jgi:choline dehydrogenase-like flavoprotein
MISFQAMKELYTEIMWDFIVIGTGMGGSTIGHALAAAGKKVLFLEKGRAYFRHDDSLEGEFSDEFALRKENAHIPLKNVLSRAGRYTSNIVDMSDGKPKPFIPFLGEGTGGSSALYGAVLERFRPEDFTPGKFYKKESGSTFPDQWPVSFEEMIPFYEAAEKLYHVQNVGRSGPLAEEMFSFLTQKKLSPYWLPVAHEYSKECPGCQGFICKGHAKYDSAKACLIPAIEQHGATLLDECEVLKINEEDGKIISVDCVSKNTKLTLKAQTFILAAGALNTPEILLRSSSQRFPNGLANSSDLVGRNLMRHYIDLYVLKPKTKFSEWIFGSGKDMAFNDLYISEGEKLGTVQSFGRLPDGEVIATQLSEEVPSAIGKVMGLFKPLMTPLFNKLFQKSYIFTSIIEDLPYSDNRVYVEGSGPLKFTYRINQEEKRRIELIRNKLRPVFASYRPMILKQAENNKRIAHACGTCRFGDDPKTSVLNAENRSHDCENLYIVDSSFFPTAGGINPSLTVAANALRVADRMLKH